MFEQLKHIMQTFEATPPPGVWQALDVRLADDEQYASLVKKMNDFEVTPPAFMWNQIAEELDDVKKNTTTTVRTISSSPKWYRMAAAAVISALLIGSGWYFLTQSSNGTQTNVAVTEKINSSEKNNITAPVLPLTGTEEKMDIAATNKKQDEKKTEQVVASEIAIANHSKSNSTPKTLINKPVLSTKKNSRIDNDVPVLRYTKVTVQPSFRENSIVITAPILLDENGNPYRDINVLSANSNYLMVAGPNGQMTRISSKFANVILFLNTDDGEVKEYLEKILEESFVWKQRFQQWRNKIKEKAITPTPGNFLDILELKELIKE
jgi:hypothetical protein